MKLKNFPIFSESFFQILLLTGWLLVCHPAAWAETVDVEWGTGVVTSPIVVNQGDQVKFTFPGSHSVVQFTGETAFNGCDFTGGILAGFSSPVTINMTNHGSFYFGCDTIGHCAGLPEKIEITVLAVSNFVVDTLLDTLDLSPGDGLCEDSGGNCSLRAAVMEHNSLGGTTTVTLPAGTITLSIAGDESNALAGDLDVYGGTFNITGAGIDTSIISADHLDRAFFLSATSATFQDLTIRDGQTTASGLLGGAISQFSALTNPNNLRLERVRLTANSARQGGAIFGAPSAVVHIVDSVIDNNIIQPSGGGNPIAGGVYCQDCELTIDSSTITGNDGTGGKVINISNGGNMTMINTTVSNNDGGGVGLTNANATIRFSTLADNVGPNVSFFSFDDTHTFTIGNSILYIETNDNCQSGDLPMSLGYNVVGDSSCSFMATGDLQNTDPMLGSLGDNGGPTQTRLPSGASAAVNLIPPGACLDADSNPLTVDQRDEIRPFGSQCDAGSVEIPVVSLEIFEDGFEDP